MCVPTMVVGIFPRSFAWVDEARHLCMAPDDHVIMSGRSGRS